MHVCVRDAFAQRPTNWLQRITHRSGIEFHDANAH